MKRKSTITDFIRRGIVRNAIRIAQLAGYKAAQPNRSYPLETRLGANPNTTMAQQERVQMMWQAESIVKNSDWVNYVLKRRAYCSCGLAYAPDTGDPVLDQELQAYLYEQWKTGGINCSMQEAFSRAADIELPTRGDSLLIWYRDESQLRLMEASADQLGELYYYARPQRVQKVASASGLTYYAGIYFAQNGQHAGFRVYERGYDQMYLNPQEYDAWDVIYFQDNLFKGVRGVSKYAPALLTIGKRDKTWQSGMDSMSVQSKIAALVSNEMGGPDELTYETVTHADGRIEYVEHFADGAVVKYQFNGDSHQFMKPEQPGQSLLDGLEYADERVCLAMGLPKSFLLSSRDSTGATSRFDMSIASRELLRIREEIHRPRLDRISYVTILDAVERRKFLPYPNITRGKWGFPPLPTADAFKESKEDIAAIRACLNTNTNVLASNGLTFYDVLRVKGQESMAIAMEVEDRNRELVSKGYKPSISATDIAQVSDNPQQAATAEQMQNPMNPMQPNDGKTVPFPVAKMSAFIGDITVSELPGDVRAEIAKTLGTNGQTDGLRVTKYGMTVSELISKADPHNLESARKHLRYCTNGACSDEVHSNNEKYILVVNDRIVDGHHFLAKAEKGKVTKSLPVIDLTPARFQVS